MMKKRKDNLFRDKFRLLNSQEHNEDIKWSSSSSSEYENTSCNEKIGNLERTGARKRKRKKKVHKNLSNLDITIIDTCKENISDSVNAKSPILVSKRVANCESPILMTCRLPPNRDIDVKSPILCTNSSRPKSPILNLKTANFNRVKVKKQLSFDKSFDFAKNVRTKESRHSDTSLKINESDSECRINNKKTTTSDENTHIKSDTISISESDSSIQSKLIEKVKNFFDSHFSSESTSQNISDTPTPSESSKNEEIEILTCKTQVPHILSTKLESSCNSDATDYVKNTKKVKHKKGGLAYRLNAMLKKYDAHISLWQHERFLAGNSNFVIPKKEYIVFHIVNIDCSYGCYLLNAIDLDNIKYLIVINCKYVKSNIFVDSVFKLYEPYKILQENKDPKIIINVCKFECAIIKA